MPNRRKVIAVIGNASPPPEAVTAAESIGRLIVEQGWRLATGGLGGVMEAASRGARQAPAYREGDVLGFLPSGDAATANPYVDIVIPSNLGIARNVLLVGAADAVVAVGGGAGTLSEIALAWQLGRVVVGLDVPGWSARLAGQRLDAKRTDTVMAARTAEEAIDLLRTTFGP
jgi:uncharacterized protein (TIGR00725 family)